MTEGGPRNVICDQHGNAWPKRVFRFCAGGLAEALVGNPSCSVAVLKKVGMPEQTQGFVDKADSKHRSFLIGARVSVWTYSRPSSGKRIARDASVDDGLVVCRRTSRNQQFTAFWFMG